jgi:hypothetical protein
MEKNKISTYFLFISIFTFIAIFFFVVQKSYGNLMKPTQEVKKSELLKPVSPTLDTAVLDDIEQRKYYSEDAVAPTPTVETTATPQ